MKNSKLTKNTFILSLSKLFPCLSASCPSILLTILLLFIQSRAYPQGWSELGGTNSLQANAYIMSICSGVSGSIYAAGYFTNASGHNYVAKYNGTSWSELGGINGLAANDNILCICADGSGNVYAAGKFTDSTGAYYIAKYNGTSWGKAGNFSPNNVVKGLCSDASGNVYAVGFFINSSGNRYVAKYNGTSWSELGGLNGLGANNDIETVYSDASGNIYAAGNFTNASGKNYVAKYNGTSWSELGGLNSLSANNSIYNICGDGAGNIYTSGAFSNNMSWQYVAKYNGTSWSELGGNGLGNCTLFALCSDVSGNIYAGGAVITTGYFMAECHANTWRGLGQYQLLADPRSICSDPSGNIYAGGYFQNTSGNYYVAKIANPSGLSDIEISNEIKIAPNPTKNSVSVLLPQSISNATIRLLDITGQNVIEKVAQSGSSFVLDLSSQPAGIYFLEIKQEDKIVVRKIARTN